MQSPSQANVRAWPRAAILLGAALLASAVAQWPALESELQNDDFLFFYQAAHLPLSEFLLKTHGGHLLMTRNAFYLAFSHAFGLEPWPYFAVSLASHLVNVALAFALLFRLTRSASLAGFAAALWGMAPAAQVTVNWVSVYGNLLVMTFLWPVLIGLVGYAQRRRPPTPLALASWALLLLAGATCFGPGVAAGLVIAPVAWLLLPAECRPVRTALWLGSVAIVLVVAYAILRPPATFGALEASTAAARVGVEAFLALWAYGLAALLLGPLVTVGDDGIALGPLQGFSLEQLVPVLGAVGLAGLVMGAWAYRVASPERRRQMLAFALLTSAMYGLIALGRTPALVAFSRPPEWLATTPRYHYAALASIAVSVAFVLAEAGKRFSWIADGAPLVRRWLPPAAALLWMAAAAIPCAMAARTIDFKFDPWSRRALDQARAAFAREIEATAPGADVYIENTGFAALGMMAPLIPRIEFPGTAAVYVFLNPEGAPGDRRVYFVESDAELVRAVRAQPETRMAHLLVTTEEARAARAAASAEPVGAAARK